jgi:hypothetical protein
MLPDTYSELYPNRFLHADQLKGRKVTLTIKNVDVEELTGENNKKAAKVILSFAERPLELVTPKTNGECLRRMFGSKPHEWVGHKITLFPSTTSFGRETVDCIRIWGSPDLPADMPITIPQGRKRALEVVLHAVKATPHVIEPRVQAAFDLLDYTTGERNAFLDEHAGKGNAEILAELDELNQQRNEKENQ